MLKAKSFLVLGETTHRDGKPHKNIAENVDKVINDFIEEIGGKLVSLYPNVQIGATQDSAFITITFESNGKKEETQTIVEEISEEEPVRRGRPKSK